MKYKEEGARGSDSQVMKVWEEATAAAGKNSKKGKNRYLG